MRGFALLIGVVGALGLTLPYPFVGLLLWSWFALQLPHQDAYGFVQSMPLNFIIAVVTIAAWMVSRERKKPSLGFIFWMLVLFLLWVTLNSFFAFSPEWSWPFWDRTWKTFLLGFVIAAMATTRNRLDALVWIVVISLFYYGVKGGLFTIITGGNFHVMGPEGTPLADNNSLAAALLMALPFANYLRGQVANKRIALLLLVCMILTIISVVGSYSRGAVIGLSVLATLALFRSRNRITYVIFGGMILLFILQLMPDQFFHRVSTISNATQDHSFEGRVDSWTVAFHYAVDHFPFGAGFYGIQLGKLYEQYLPGHFPHAVHSIYFQVLGEQGFVGLAIYLAILGGAFVRCARLISLTRKLDGLRWANDLAVAIQASLLVFAVAGAALPLAYYDLFVIGTAMLIPLTAIVERRAGNSHQPWNPSQSAMSADFAMDKRWAPTAPNDMLAKRPKQMPRPFLTKGPK